LREIAPIHGVDGFGESGELLAQDGQDAERRESLVMSWDDHIRVAWQADQEGHATLRDAMLTLAIASSDPDHAWAERCRAKLLADRPYHFLGAQPNLERALKDPRVLESIAKLESRYPLSRVRWLRMKHDASTGPYTGQTAPIHHLIDDLVGPPAEAEVRRDKPEAVRGPLARSKAAVRSGSRIYQSTFDHSYIAPFVKSIDLSEEFLDDSTDAESAPSDSIEALYLTVLLAIALLLAVVRNDPDRRAA
jgi:hypothetical protein